MIGSIIGDIIGSIWEGKQSKSKDVELFCEYNTFTDDSVLTLAVAEAILKKTDYQTEMIKYYKRYPHAGYGYLFNEWANSTNPQPYRSYGNGSAMRVSPIGFAFHDIETVLDEARKSAAITHNSPDGIAGAKAIALAIFMAREGNTKEEIRAKVSSRCRFEIKNSVEELKIFNEENWAFNGSSIEESVPVALLCFLDATDYEDTIRNALYLGGDTDTIACMAGGIAQAFYREIPDWIIKETRNRLNGEQLDVVDSFNRAYGIDYL
ncbi:MAG: ADP-ribosylglycohydrolase family protein [Candidatus Marinimicrobia bacterium]|nr:ADP-ribosylglycohydrolase family protein [Candidatus Neomarinimicrobiota bacterium]